MLRKLKLAGVVIAVGAAVTVACNWWGPSLVPPTFDPTTVVLDTKQGGDRAILVTVATPGEGAYQAQATVHRWVANDVYQYEAALQYWNGSAYVAFSPAINVVVPNKVDPKTKAAFTNLKQGRKYQVSVIAKGNVGGSAASSTLTSSAATAVFDFTATQDVEDTLGATVQVSLDPVAFSGSAHATVSSPIEGTYQNPTATESGAPQ